MKKGNIAAIAGLLFILSLFGYSYFNDKASAPPPDQQLSLDSGAADDNNTGGSAAEIIEEAKNNGESMWLFFRSNTCVPCVQMQQIFVQLQPDYEGKVRFINIDVDDRDNQEISRSYKIQYIPTTFIIDGAGEISYQNVGVISAEDMKKELDKVVQ